MQHPPAPYPLSRPRRLRMQAWSRALTAETRLLPEDLILPLFVQEGKNERTKIAPLPGVARESVDLLIEKIKRAKGLGIPAIALFPATDPRLKTGRGEEALNPQNLVCRAIAAIKEAVPGIGIIADVALDPYTSHGHDGVLNARGEVDNDATVEMLSLQSLALARAGADVVAPSDMMDGRVRAIRAALEAEGHANTLILAYSAKYASAFYGPFREAVGSAGAIKSADKLTYQMHPANSREALLEATLDASEGADMLMVKPALPYLDVLARVSEASPLPVLAYQVSGEYAMLRAAAAAGMLNAEAAMKECLLSIKRAGARGIFSYAALEVAESL